MKRRRRLTGSGAHRLSSPEKLQLDVTISSQSHGKEASSGDDGGTPTERSNNNKNINNNPTQRRASTSDPFCLKNSFYSLFISQAPAAHWSLHTGMSHSLASLWRLMKLPWVLLTDTIRFKKPKKQEEKHQWRTQPPACARLQVWVTATGWTGGGEFQVYSHGICIDLGMTETSRADVFFSVQGLFFNGTYQEM